MKPQDRFYLGNVMTSFKVDLMLRVLAIELSLNLGDGRGQAAAA